MFINNTDLLEDSCVINLIEYRQDLEGQVMELNSKTVYNKEDKLISILSDIDLSVKETLRLDSEQERFGQEQVDFKIAIINLSKYIDDIKRTYKLKL